MATDMENTLSRLVDRLRGRLVLARHKNRLILGAAKRVLRYGKTADLSNLRYAVEWIEKN